MEFHSIVEVKEAERQSKLQRLGFTHLLRVDESKVTSPKDLTLLHRVRAAAAERSEAFDAMLRDHEVNRLFNDGALYFDGLGERMPR